MTIRDSNIGWQKRASSLRREVIALLFVWRDRRVPWYVRLLAAAVAAYALSPIDLIPDFIPFIGYLDDLVIVPAGVMLVRALIPRQILEEYRARAEQVNRLPYLRLGAIIVAIIWLAAGLLVTFLVLMAVL